MRTPEEFVPTRANMHELGKKSNTLTKSTVTIKKTNTNTNTKTMVPKEEIVERRSSVSPPRNGPICPCLDALFNPTSVAVIGASRVPGKVGHDIFVNILRGKFTGTLYPVNPKAKSIACVPTYKDIMEIAEPVDMAIIILPPKYARVAVRRAIDKGVKAIVIVSAGFKEVGGIGLEIERQIVVMAREAGVCVVGPNCLGVINPLPHINLNASFSARMPAPGNMSFISQSGALCTAVLDFAADKDIGFSKFISIGNKADVDELDLIRYLHADPETEVIMLYIEQLHRGAEFIKAVRQITGGDNPKPVLAIKSGRTIAGAEAAASHTGSLAGSEAVYDALLLQSGIIRVDSINELFDFGVAFAYKNANAVGKMRHKVPTGKRLAIVTNAGGPGIVATDITISSGLELAKFSAETIEVLKRDLPPTANVHNPVDVIGDAADDRYENALAAVIDDEGVDGALVILTPQSMTNAIGTAEAIVRIARFSRKPILSCFMGIIDVSAGVRYLQANGVPTYRFPESAAKAFGALYRYSQWINRPQPKPFTFHHNKQRATDIIRNALDREHTYIGEIGGTELLQCYGFNVLPTVLAKSACEAADAADKLGYPVVMKIVSADIVHKSDAGGVIVGVDSREKVNETYGTIVDNAKKFKPDADISGVLIQRLAPEGHEVILGMTRYPTFGPLMMFGAGGTFVEVFEDVAFRLAPLNRNMVHNMVRSVKGYKLLTGYRGAPKADVATIERMLVALSDLVSDHPEIKEVDINPLLVHPEGEGVTVADCRFILKTIGNPEANKRHRDRTISGCSAAQP